ncbi:MAG: hypothetical protein AAF363_08725 [Bacteroidota bacterium]
MKRFIINLSICLFSTVAAYAQSEEAREKIESAKIALITERLGLSPEKAEKFWPVYREFTEKRQGLRREFSEAKSKVNLENATEEQKRNLLDLRLKLKEQEVGLEREYSDRLLGVISTKQILSLRQAEEDFRSMLLDRIRQRRLQQQRTQDQRRQRNEQLRNRRNN